MAKVFIAIDGGNFYRKLKSKEVKLHNLLEFDYKGFNERSPQQAAGYQAVIPDLIGNLDSRFRGSDTLAASRGE